jgi:hypothetical protein
MSIVSNASSSESSVEPDPNLLDRLVDNEDALSNVSDLSLPLDDRPRNEFYIPDVSDQKWASYGDLGHTAEQMSASYLPDHSCSTRHLQQHGIILEDSTSTLFSAESPSGVETQSFWEEHDCFDQFLKSSDFGQSSKPEDPISPGSSKLQARPSMLIPKSKAPGRGFLKRILRKAKSVRS